MKKKNQWIEHLKEIKKQHPELSFKERIKLAQETYKKDGEEIKNYITRGEFNKSIKYGLICFVFWLGLLFIIPVLYSITANTKNYLGFYGMIVVGFFCIGYSTVEYLKWRKKYV